MKLNNIENDLLGDFDDRYEQRIRDKAFKELNERILPSIRGKHLVQGRGANGPMQREIDDTVKNYMESVEDALLKNPTHAPHKATQSGSVAQFPTNLGL